MLQNLQTLDFLQIQIWYPEEKINTAQRRGTNEVRTNTETIRVQLHINLDEHVLDKIMLRVMLNHIQTWNSDVNEENIL